MQKPPVNPPVNPPVVNRTRYGTFPLTRAANPNKLNQSRPHGPARRPGAASSITYRCRASAGVRGGAGPHGHKTERCGAVAHTPALRALVGALTHTCIHVEQWSTVAVVKQNTRPAHPHRIVARPQRVWPEPNRTELSLHRVRSNASGDHGFSPLWGGGCHETDSGWGGWPYPPPPHPRNRTPPRFHTPNKQFHGIEFERAAGRGISMMKS